MSWTINEMAELFGLSADTIRFYEKKGILSPSRNSSGYRRFSDEEFCNLLDCKRYSGFGFTLQTIADYFNGIDEEFFFACLRENDQTRYLNNRMQASISRHWKETINTIEMMPLHGEDIYAKKFQEKIAIVISEDTDPVFDPRNSLHVLNKGNLNALLAISDIKRGFVFDPVSGRWKWKALCLVFDKQDMGLMQIPEDVFLHEYPASYCFCKSVRINDLDEHSDHINSCLSAVRAKGFQASGPVFANSLIRVRLDNIMVRYTEIEIPIKNKMRLSLTEQE